MSNWAQNYRQTRVLALGGCTFALLAVMWLNQGSGKVVAKGKSIATVMSSRPLNQADGSIRAYMTHVRLPSGEEIEVLLRPSPVPQTGETIPLFYEEIASGQRKYTLDHVALGDEQGQIQDLLKEP